MADEQDVLVSNADAQLEVQPPDGGEEAQQSGQDEPAALEQQAEQLDQQSSALTRQLNELHEELRQSRRDYQRLESRFDRGQDPAALKELRTNQQRLEQSIRSVQETLGSVSGLQEAMDLVMQSTLDPEQLQQFRSKQSEKALATERQRREAAEKQLQERADRITVTPPSSPQPERPAQPQAQDSDLNRYAERMNDRIEAAGYDPNDTASQQRLVAAAGALVDERGVGLPYDQQFKQLSEALKAVQDEDRRTEQQATRRQEARGAVRVDRARTNGGGGTYRHLEDLERAYANNEISTADFLSKSRGLQYSSAYATGLREG